MNLDKEINDSWNHFWPLTLKYEGPEHFELVQFTWKLHEGEFWGSIKWAFFFYLCGSCVVPGIACGPTTGRVGVAWISSGFLDLGCWCLSSQISLLLVKRNEVKLEEFEADWCQTLHIELLTSNLFGEELTDLREVENCCLCSL